MNVVALLVVKKITHPTLLVTVSFNQKVEYSKSKLNFAYMILNVRFKILLNLYILDVCSEPNQCTSGKYCKKINGRFDHCLTCPKSCMADDDNCKRRCDGKFNNVWCLLHCSSNWQNWAHARHNSFLHLAVPTDCEWNGWVTGTCSKKCGGGTLTKTRTKKVQESNDGNCEGISAVQETCNKQNCVGNMQSFHS